MIEENNLGSLEEREKWKKNGGGLVGRRDEGMAQVEKKDQKGEKWRRRRQVAAAVGPAAWGSEDLRVSGMQTGIGAGRGAAQGCWERGGMQRCGGKTSRRRFAFAPFSTDSRDKAGSLGQLARLGLPGGSETDGSSAQVECVVFLEGEIYLADALVEDDVKKT